MTIVYEKITKGQVLPAKQLNEKGQCCGRKPTVYKRQKMLWCLRCSAAFDIETGQQIQNWSYDELEDGSFQAKYSR